MGSGVAGKWVVVNAIEIDYEDEVEVFRADMFSHTGAYLEFEADGKGSMYDGEANTDAFTYTATKDSLVLKYIEGEDVTTYRIKELTRSTLRIHEEHIENYDGVVHKELIEISLQKSLT